MSDDRDIAKMLDLDNKRLVSIDDHTWLLVPKDRNPEETRERFIKNLKHYRNLHEKNENEYYY